MFLLVSGRHVGAHTDGHQHGVSIQISVNLGKKFLRISRIRKIAVTRILATVFTYLPYGIPIVRRCSVSYFWADSFNRHMVILKQCHLDFLARLSLFWNSIKVKDKKPWITLIWLWQVDCVATKQKKPQTKQKINGVSIGHETTLRSFVLPKNGCYSVVV